MSSMVCQNCRENPATIHYTNIDDDDARVEVNYCEECAASHGIPSDVSIPHKLATVVAAAAAAPSTDLACPHCGITFSEFRKKGRLGCPMDYEQFRVPLEVILRSEHDNQIRHRGRLPHGRVEAQSTVNERLLYLRRELNGAVEDENYEQAARLRDEIRRIESGSLDFLEGDLAGEMGATRGED
jgi:protein arginine kinase activator